MGSKDDVLSALDGAWRTGRQIHERVGIWSQATIQVRLRKLAAIGIVEVRYEQIPSGEVAYFRLKADAAQTAAAP